MSKYLYPIYKLKTKSYIKWWLYNYLGKFNYILSEILTGTEFYLEDTTDNKFNLFIPIGRTTQESTTGANLIKNNRGTFITTGLTFIHLGDGQYDINGTTTGSLDGYLDLNLGVALEKNTTYTMFYEVLEGTASNLGVMNFAVNGTRARSTVANMYYLDVATVVSKGIKKKTFTTSSEDETLTRTNIYIAGSGRVFNHLKIRCMIYKGTEDISWEKYTGGEASPNPNYPQDIKNTGDNGSVNEKVQNKNLFDINKRLLGTIDDNGDLVINGTTLKFYEDDFKENTQYTLSAYVKSPSGSVRFRIYYTDETFNDLVLYNGTNEYQYMTFTTTANKTLDYISMYYGNVGQMYIKNGELQIEQGSTATSYVPHEEQNLSFPLAQGQKLMEGDYLADDGVHHLWNEDTVDGTTATFSDAKTNGAYYCDQKVAGNLTGQTITFDTSVTNATVQYELAEEQTEDFTEEQQTAWDQIKALRTYKPVTHISSEDETPAELKIQYYKER